MKKFLIIIFVLAFALRIGFVFSAYHGDLNNNISWGEAFVQRGPVDFYESSNWQFSAPNQPPLYILLFGGCVWLFKTISDLAWYLNDQLPLFPSTFIWFWEQKGIILLVKLPAVLADLGIAYFIYRFFARTNQKRLGVGLSALWLLNPVSWYNSAIWGQTDAIVNFLGLGAVLALFSGYIWIFLMLISVSLLFKGSLAILILILLFFAIGRELLGGKFYIKKWLTGICLSGLVIVLITVWFHPRIDLPFYLWRLYQERIFPGEIGYLTANAFNFWWLIDAGKTLDHKVFLGLSARAWGLGIAFLGVIMNMFWIAKRRFSQKSLVFSLVFLSLLIFLFMTRIHERYMYPLFPLGTVLLGINGGFVLPYIILSLTHLLNLYHLFWFPPAPLLESLYVQSWFPNLLSVINLIVLAFMFRQQRTSKL